MVRSTLEALCFVASTTLETISLLEDHGWRQTTTENFRMRQSDFSFRHSLQFVNTEGLEMDLHWHALYLACFRGADESFWKDSERQVH